MNDLENIQEGDHVALNAGGWSHDVRKCRVTRTTPTRIYLGDVAYTRRGCRVGSGSRWDRERISAWNEEVHGSIVAESRLRRVRRDLANFSWEQVDQATADAVLELITPKVAPGCAVSVREVRK